MMKQFLNKQWHLACAGLSLLGDNAFVGWKRKVNVKAGKNATVKMSIKPTE